MAQNYHIKSLKQLECMRVRFPSYMAENIQKF